MSTMEPPEHVIAKALSFGGIENHLPAAAHVVSKLTDAGYSIMPSSDVTKRHRGIEPDTEMGGVACSECGWHLSGRTVDNDTQERHHRQHAAAAEGETP